MTEPEGPGTGVRRSSWILGAVASLCGAALYSGLACVTLGPSPSRDVFFEGGWEKEHASCQGPVVWTGEVAWAACDWVYRSRALIQLHPEEARATVLHRWTVDDGNTPDLHIVGPCEDGRLFVIAETEQTTVVTVRPGGTTGNAVPVRGDSVLGAACREGAVELFVRDGEGYSVGRATEGRLERSRTLAQGDVPGPVMGAWLESGQWHAVVRPRADGSILVGEPGGTFLRTEAACIDRSCCLMGDPGGWLCVDGSLNIRRVGTVLTRLDGAFRATPVEPPSDSFVFYMGGGGQPALGLTRGGSGVMQFRGLGALDFELADRGSVFEARRPPNGAVTIAKGSFSSLDSKPRALPLSGGRVAVWGGLGDEVVTLGSDLRREDGIGVLGRIVRPFGRFRSSSNSTFDQVCYFTLLLATPVWFVLSLIGFRRRPKPDERRLRGVALGYLVLFAIGVWGFYNVLIWI